MAKNTKPKNQTEYKGLPMTVAICVKCVEYVRDAYALSNAKYIQGGEEKCFLCKKKHARTQYLLDKKQRTENYTEV
jgi:hypothetical protein